MDVKKMADVMKKIPQYTEAKDRYSLHIEMISSIFDNYEKKKQRKYGELEQTIVSMVGKDGKKVKPGDLFNDVMESIN